MTVGTNFPTARGNLLWVLCVHLPTGQPDVVVLLQDTVNHTAPFSKQVSKLSHKLHSSN